MTLTTRSMEWLNANRRRAYPLARDAWRRRNPSNPGFDAILLDALVLDTDAKGTEELVLESADVGREKTIIGMKYGGSFFSVDLSGGTESGSGSFSCLRGIVRGTGLRGASVSLAFSSHAYLLGALGIGKWTFGCPVLRSRLIAVSDGMGVESLKTGGSAGVEGHGEPAEASGDVVLEDGYRTSPIVYGGKVFVRVGRRYGLDPCHYDFGDAGARDCRNPLFFFCGQNAVNGGNVMLRGGRGIIVTQGGSYTVDDDNSKANGRTVPCIEISAGRELLDICRPAEEK